MCLPLQSWRPRGTCVIGMLSGVTTYFLGEKKVQQGEMGESLYETASRTYPALPRNE